MAKTSTKESLDQPFSATVWRRATEVAGKYGMLVGASDNRFFAKCVEMPGIVVFGKTAEDAIEALHEPLTIAIASLLEADRKVPAPMVEGKRESQVNVKLTAEERVVVEAAAKREGFTGLSDFFRHAALRLARA